MKQAVKLTDIQVSILQPLFNAKANAEQNINSALLLITGKPIGKYSIENGELVYESVETETATEK